MSWLVDNPEILRGYRRGERAALETIYRHYAADLRRFVSCGFTFSSGGRQHSFRGFDNPLDVDDVLQEVFIRALSEPARLHYDGLRPFRNYLLTIARNVVLRDLGRVMRLVSLDDDQAPCPAREQLAEERTPSPEQAALDGQLAELVGRFVGELSHHDRRFYGVRFAEQQTQAQTARRLKLTRAKVKTHEKRIRARFLKFMRHEGWSFDVARRHALCATPTALLVLALLGVCGQRDHDGGAR